MRVSVRDFPLFGKRKQSKLLLEILKMERIKFPRNACSTMRFFSAIFHLLVKGNTTIKLQLQVDLAFYQEIKLHVRGHEAESVSVGLID